MLKLKTVFLIIIAGIFVIGFRAFYPASDQDTPIDINAPKTDLSDKGSALSEHEEPYPVIPLVTADSVFVWNDSLYDFLATRLFDESKDIPADPVEVQPQTGGPPVVLDWATLTDIEYRSEYFEEMEMDLYSPIFSERLKALNGKQVEITGYVIPVVDDGTEIALSQNPYAACFFCGKASPASVMTVRFSKRIRRLRTDDHRTFVGQLRLNYDDPNQFYYILENAEMRRP